MEEVPIITDDDVTLNEQERSLIQVHAHVHGAIRVAVHLGSPDSDGCPMFDCEFVLPKQRFQRIRRITGYLVGTLDRWNSAKQAEERDRVKHGVLGKDNNVLTRQ